MSNKTILEQANAAMAAGNVEGFLAHCAEDIVWTAVGGSTLEGKTAVRAMYAGERAPPAFSVATMVCEGEFVVAMGQIGVRDGTGQMRLHPYCDVWRFHNGKMAELRAFVIDPGNDER